MGTETNLIQMSALDPKTSHILCLMLTFGHVTTPAVLSSPAVSARTNARAALVEDCVGESDGALRQVRGFQRQGHR